ncbi:hypothetical protein ACHWQZ_G006966 [Mnemiopsis leidyi]
MDSRFSEAESLTNHMISLNNKGQVPNKNLAENSGSTGPIEEIRLEYTEKKLNFSTLDQSLTGDNLTGPVRLVSSDITPSESDQHSVCENTEGTSSSSIFGARPLQPALQSSVYSVPTLTSFISINDDSFKLPRYQRELYEKHTKSFRLRKLVSEHRNDMGHDFVDIDKNPEMNSTAVSPLLPEQKRPKYTFVPGPPSSPAFGDESSDQELSDSSHLNTNGESHQHRVTSTGTDFIATTSTALSPRMRCADSIIPKPGPNENVDDWIRGMEILLGLSVDSRLSDVTETDVESSHEDPINHSTSRHEPLPGQVDDSADVTAEEIRTQNNLDGLVIPRVMSPSITTKKPLRVRTRNAVRRVCAAVRQRVRSVVSILRRES